MSIDPWVNEWKINVHENHILDGIEGLQFRFRRRPNTVDYPQYDIRYKATDPRIDPFKKSRFFEFGNKFPKSPLPADKLKMWSDDLSNYEKDRYKKLVQNTFSMPSCDFRRLEGEKEVDGIKEALTVYLIPEAIANEASGPDFFDLLFICCKTGSIVHFLAKPVKPDRQDGTAHGNPR